MASDVKISRRTVVMLTLLAFVPYLNALRAGFTLDDVPTVRNNPAVSRGVDLMGILSSPLPPMENLYRPFTVLTYAVNEQLAPENAAAFHAVNIILHTAITILVLLTAARLFESYWVGILAAMLFAVHPIHTEAVTSIVGRAELLVAFFGLTAMLTAARSDRSTHRWSRLAFELLSVTSYFLALFSKESAVTLLPLIVLFRIVCRKEALSTGLATEFRSLTWVPYALGTVLFIVCRYHVVGSVALGNNLTPLDNALGFVPWDVRLRSALGVLWDYFGLLNVPLVLSADYSYHQVPLVNSWLDARFLAGSALLSIAALVVVSPVRPAVKLAVALPFIALSLTTNLLFPIGTIKGERLLYVPSVGWVLLAAYAFERMLNIRRYRALAAGALVLIVTTFAVRTWMRNYDWRDDPTLFAITSRNSPDSAKAHYNFGVALQNKGALAEAVAEYQEALTIASWTEGAAFGMGVISEKSGHIAAAVRWYQQALDIAPDYDEAHTNLCHVLFNTEQFAAAAAACRAGLRYKPADANLLKGLGASLVALGDTEKGIELLRRSLALNTRDHELQIYVARLERTSAESATEAVGVE